MLTARPRGTPAFGNNPPASLGFLPGPSRSRLSVRLGPGAVFFQRGAGNEHPAEHVDAFQIAVYGGVPAGLGGNAKSLGGLSHSETIGNENEFRRIFFSFGSDAEATEVARSFAAARAEHPCLVG